MFETVLAINMSLEDFLGSLNILVTSWAILTLKVWETSSLKTWVIIISQHSPIPEDLNLHHRDNSKKYILSKVRVSSQNSSC